MKRGLQGNYIIQRIEPEPFKAFVPSELPPDPPLILDSELQDRLEHANRALGRLDGLAMLLPEISVFLYFYVRKEALLSSQIEGTQSSLSDLLLFESNELPGLPIDDVREVSNYVAALNFGIERIRNDAPLTSRLLREIHAILLTGSRGGEQQPGEFRRSQNWIGGSRPGNAAYVPPPTDEVVPCMAALEKFLHDQGGRTPTLVKAALAHVQFETIHPFLDGNGRLGRLLITLILCYENALREPLLYLSLFLKANRSEYYSHLQTVRTDGEWEEWLSFFLTGVSETSEQAAVSARQILELFERDRRKIETSGKATGTLLRLHHLLQKKPLLSISTAKESLGLSYPAVSTAIDRLTEYGIVRKSSGNQRNRIFVYNEYIEILSEGTTPL